MKGALPRKVVQLRKGQRKAKHDREAQAELDERRLIDERRNELAEIERLNSAIEHHHRTVPGEESASLDTRRAAYLLRRKKDRRKQCKEIMDLRLVGLSNKEVAEVMELDEHVVIHRIAEGRREGWVTRDDEQRLRDMIEPLAIEGLTDLLIRRDKDAILETVRGRGFLKQHQAIRNVQSSITEMRVIIETQGSGSGDVRPSLPGEIIDLVPLVSHGTPRLEEGETAPTLQELATQEKEPEPITEKSGFGGGTPRTSAE